ncbi:hypothetical protein GBO34_00740 [Roseivirga pacifica]|uniref:hypothetical protein n=1 Tax=Roseivirga pacifica TaxID=1267423 RepID=UPI002096053A|nr:hypothetical protein [Roseivirga pacifica]MCO6367839.1 hypothetical protein [Roseivirga pacifica]MCO6377211.1 hypothetical protein [Roseivirga pacifica]
MSFTVEQLRVLIAAMNGRIEGDEITAAFEYVASLLEQNDTSSVINLWDVAETYDTPAAENGNPSYTESGERLWRSKVDGNVGNEPPSDSETTEDTYWLEVSKGETNPFKEWTPGIYGAGLIVLFHNDSLYKLNVASRPFESVNIEEEVKEEKWMILTDSPVNSLKVGNINFSEEFPWLGITPKSCSSVGRSLYSSNVYDYAITTHSNLIGGGVVWVDGPNGNDANDGTESFPVKTIPRALELNPSHIKILEGSYRPFDFRATDVQANKIKILQAVGKVTICELADDAATATWVQHSSYGAIYSMNLNSAYKDVLTVLDHSQQDRVGQPRSLHPYNSVIELNTFSNGTGYFHDTGTDTLYLRYTSSIDVNSIKSNLEIVTGDASSKCLFYGTKILFEGPFFFKGVFLQPLYYSPTSSRPYLYMDLKSDDGPNVSYAITHGLDSLGATTYLQGVWIHRTRGDNFHYTDSTVPSYGVEIDVYSTFAGNKEGYPSAANTSNGSSIHGNCEIVRFNGLYELNFGPEIVDTGNGKSLNIGVKVGRSVDSGNSYGLYSILPQMWCIFCEATGLKNADIAVSGEGNSLHIYSVNYNTKSEVSGGEIDEEYNPYF